MGAVAEVAACRTRLALCQVGLVLGVHFFDIGTHPVGQVLRVVRQAIGIGRGLGDHAVQEVRSSLALLFGGQMVGQALVERHMQERRLKRACAGGQLGTWGVQQFCVHGGALVRNAFRMRCGPRYSHRANAFLCVVIRLPLAQAPGPDRRRPGARAHGSGTGTGPALPASIGWYWAPACWAWAGARLWTSAASC